MVNKEMGGYLQIPPLSHYILYMHVALCAIAKIKPKKFNFYWLSPVVDD